jgi:hypothetical protein
VHATKLSNLKQKAMKKISVKNIVTFRSKPEKNQKAFLNNLDKDKGANSEGGGDYWVRSLSALSAAVKEKSAEPVKKKIVDISNDSVPALTKQTRDMYARNLNVLHNYENFNFEDWLPVDYEILNKTSKKAIIEIDDIPVQITPSQVFAFVEDGDRYVGAIWFLAKLKNFKKPELGVFAEALHIYLTSNFEKDYQISPKNCLVIDVLSREEINYQMLLDEEIPALLRETLQNIKEAGRG